MRRVLLVTCLSVLLGSAGRAEPEPIAVVAIDSLPMRQRVDLGAAEVGARVSGKIELRNDLGKPVTIRSLDPDCGCLDVTKSGSSMDPGESIVLGVTLAPTRKIGVIRRSIRFLFEEARQTPFDLTLDTKVSGPIEFDRYMVELKTAGAPFAIHGIKRHAGVDILSVQSVRGGCEVVSLQQNAEEFEVLAKPLFSFGSTNELFRVRYRPPADAAESEKAVTVLATSASIKSESNKREAAKSEAAETERAEAEIPGAEIPGAEIPGAEIPGAETTETENPEPALTVDLPLELRGTVSVRFLPSASPLLVREGQWFVRSRIVLTPGSRVRADELQFAVIQANGEPANPEDYTIALSPISVVLIGLQATGKASAQSDQRPARLKVAQSDGQQLATLELVSH